MKKIVVNTELNDNEYTVIYLGVPIDKTKLRSDAKWNPNTFDFCVATTEVSCGVKTLNGINPFDETIGYYLNMKDENIKEYIETVLVNVILKAEVTGVLIISYMSGINPILEEIVNKYFRTAHESFLNRNSGNLINLKYILLEDVEKIKLESPAETTGPKVVLPTTSVKQF